jgi:hypothetical protein
MQEIYGTSAAAGGHTRWPQTRRIAGYVCRRLRLGATCRRGLISFFRTAVVIPLRHLELIPYMS